MPLNGEPQSFPRMPGQQADVMPGSPLALVALFTEVIRERFRPGNGLAWIWDENPTPADTEANDTIDPRKVLIEPAFVENNEVRNFRPAIIIDKGETNAEKVVLGNFVGQQLKTGLKGYYSLATVPIDVEVVSDQKGESATLADIVWFYLLAGKEEICRTFGLHEFTNPVLGRTVPAEVDRTQWSTHISFQIQVNLRWSTVPISPLLREFVLRFRRSGETNPDAFLLSQYIR